MGSFTWPFGGFEVRVDTFSLNLWDNRFRNVQFSTLAKRLLAPVVADKEPKKTKLVIFGSFVMALLALESEIPC